MRSNSFRLIIYCLSWLWLNQSRATCDNVDFSELQNMLHDSNVDYSTIVQNLLNYTADSDRDWTWLQIGSNTIDPLANSNDPMLQFLPKFSNWRKIFVEPIPPLFKELQKNILHYGNATAITAAISHIDNDEASTAVMYCLDPKHWVDPNVPAHSKQICSFSKHHITKHFPNLEAVSINVTSVSVSLLLHEYPIYDIGFMLIDTEGYDYHVLKQIPFQNRLFRRPLAIMYERSHLFHKEVMAVEYLNENCYAVPAYLKDDFKADNVIAFDINFLRSNLGKSFHKPLGVA